METIDVTAYYIHHQTCNHNATWILRTFGMTGPVANIYYMSMIDDLSNENCPWCKMNIPIDQSYIVQKENIPSPIYAIYQGWKQTHPMINGRAPIAPPENREWHNA